MKRQLKSIFFALLLLVFSPGLNALQGNQRQSTPLPDDDPSRTQAAPEHMQVKPAPAGSGATSVADQDWHNAWKDSTRISGIKVDFRVVPSLKDVVVKRGSVPVNLSELTSSENIEGEQAILQFRFTDPTGTPMTGLRVASWLDQTQGKSADDKACHTKIESFLQMKLAARPEVDLNSYYVLALTQEPNILVIDPRIGFSSSKLYAVIDLAAPGNDWALTGDNDRLFVSMPSINKIAVVDTLMYRTTSNIEAGKNPMRMVLQPDGKYLWIDNDSNDAAESGVTVIDASSLKVKAHIATGRGHHDIAFDDKQNAYITNKEDGTVSIVSAQTMAMVKSILVGQEPISMAYSTQSKAMYVAAFRGGSVTEISADDYRVISTMKAKPGLTAVRITPDGRWGFVTNGAENTVLLFDASTSKFQQTYNVGRSPDQLAFSNAYAYVRSRESENVNMIPLSDLGKNNSTAHFVAGQSAPGLAADLLAGTIAPSLDGSSAFVANPADRRIYYYEEGMAAPMFSIEGYGKTPKSAMVLDRSIHETSPGIYSVGVRLPKAAKYDVPLFVDSPGLSHCFDLTVATNPALKQGPAVAVKLHPLKNYQQVPAGEPVQVAFRLTQGDSDKPQDGLKDVQVMVLLAEGLRQLHFDAEPEGNGVYHFTFTPPKQGVYYAMVHIPSLKVKANQLPYMMVRAKTSN
jgi:DNA-binding beta-propeller fold protein YncE